MQNDGFDGTGVHCGNVTDNKTPITAPLFDKDCYQMNFAPNVKVNSSIQKALYSYFAQPKVPWWLVVKQKVQKKLSGTISLRQL